MLTTAIADSVMFISGNPGCYGDINPKESRESGLNRFMKELDVTWRRDLTSGRLRINSDNSSRDSLQKGNILFYEHIE